MKRAKSRRKKTPFNYFDAARDRGILVIAARIDRMGRSDWLSDEEKREILGRITNEPTRTVLQAVFEGKAKKLRGQAQKLHRYVVALAKLHEAAEK